MRQKDVELAGLRGSQENLSLAIAKLEESDALTAELLRELKTDNQDLRGKLSDCEDELRYRDNDVIAARQQVEHTTAELERVRSEYQSRRAELEGELTSLRQQVQTVQVRCG